MKQGMAMAILSSWLDIIRRRDPSFGAVQDRAASSAGVFLIFNETIRDWVNTATNPSNGVKRSASELHYLVAFHEILHFFDFNDYRIIGNLNPAYDPDADGDIMRNYWLLTPTIPLSVLTLSPAQIRKIQKKDYLH